MAIKSRDSNDHLHTDVILSKITEYDIFVYYCPTFKELGKKFKQYLYKRKNGLGIKMMRNSGLNTWSVRKY